MGKGGRSKTQMRYVCRPKKNVADQCFAPTCDTIFPSSITPNCDMFSTFYPLAAIWGWVNPPLAHVWRRIGLETHFYRSIFSRDIDYIFKVREGVQSIPRIKLPLGVIFRTSNFRIPKITKIHSFEPPCILWMCITSIEIAQQKKEYRKLN